MEPWIVATSLIFLYLVVTLIIGWVANRQLVGNSEDFLLYGEVDQSGVDVVVTIVDSASGLPVSGATVSGNFSGAFSESGSAVTDASGVATITTGAKTRLPFSFTFTVTNVTGPGYDYNPAGNVDYWYWVLLL